MESAVSGAAFTSLAFSSFQGCIRAIVLFNTAQNIGIDGDLFRIGLEIQHYRLVQWATRVGLLEDGTQNDKINWNLAHWILEQLLAFLTSADELRRRYALQISEEDIHQADLQLKLEPPKQGLARLMSKLKPDTYTKSSKIINSSNGPLKKLQWASVGKDKAKRILEEIEKLVNYLELLLDSADRNARTREDAQLLRGLVSLAASPTEAGHIRDIIETMPVPETREFIREAARAKQVRLVFGLDKRDDEIQPKGSAETRKFTPELKKCKKPLQPWTGTRLAYKGIEFAKYDGKQALVQWKVAEGADWAKYADNIKRLVVLLTSISHESFRALPCHGYYPALSAGRHGIIFNTPDESKSWSMRSLSDLFKSQKQLSLSRRMGICRVLAQAILQLHTAGWMHKNIRSNNIIFLAPEGSDDEDHLQEDPYIIGFDYARPDTTTAAAMTQAPEEDLYADLYRHKDARGLLRESYQKDFDMYSLGCILVELALWEPLIDIQTRHWEINWQQRLDEATLENTYIEVPSILELFEDGDIEEDIKHGAGDLFLKTVRTCLALEDTDTQEETGIANQMAVVELLKKLTVDS